MVNYELATANRLLPAGYSILLIVLPQDPADRRQAARNKQKAAGRGDHKESNS
jgi:hypothetical protein